MGAQIDLLDEIIVDNFGLSELTVGLRDFERIANLQLKLWDGGKVRVGAYSFSKLWKR